MTHEAKRDMVARLAAGADALGVDEILIVREPFSIAEKALQHMKLKAKSGFWIYRSRIQQRIRRMR